MPTSIFAQHVLWKTAWRCSICIFIVQARYILLRRHHMHLEVMELEPMHVLQAYRFFHFTTIDNIDRFSYSYFVSLTIIVSSLCPAVVWLTLKQKYLWRNVLVSSVQWILAGQFAFFLVRWISCSIDNIYYNEIVNHLFIDWISWQINPWMSRRHMR